MTKPRLENTEFIMSVNHEGLCMVLPMLLSPKACLFIVASMFRFRAWSPAAGTAAEVGGTVLTPSASLKAVCDVTQYPNSCFSSISLLKTSNTTDPEVIFKLSLHTAINAASKLAGLVTGTGSRTWSLLTMVLYVMPGGGGRGGELSTTVTTNRIHPSCLPRPAPNWSISGLADDLGRPRPAPPSHCSMILDSQALYAFAHDLGSRNARTYGPEDGSSGGPVRTGPRSNGIGRSNVMVVEAAECRSVWFDSESATSSLCSGLLKQMTMLLLMN